MKIKSFILLQVIRKDIIFANVNDKANETRTKIINNMKTTITFTTNKIANKIISTINYSNEESQSDTANGTKI